MKKIFALLSLIFAFSFVSCDSDLDLDGLVIDAKWIIENSDKYESFEFNSDGDYIVILNTYNMAEYTPNNTFIQNNAITSRSDDSDIIVGTYVGNGDNAVVMDGIGEIEIITSDSASVSFNLTLQGETQAITLRSSVAETVSTSSKTNLFCRKWNFVGFKIDGEDYDMETNVEGYGFAESILFSKAGTYLVTSSVSEMNNKIAQWKWKNEDEGTFKYTWDSFWEEDDFATITTLTSTKLVVDETIDNSVHQSIFEAAN